MISSDASYNLFSSRSIIGSGYVAVRKECSSPMGDRLNFNSSLFYLNEGLVIQVQVRRKVKFFGESSDEKVLLILRFHD